MSFAAPPVPPMDPMEQARRRRMQMAGGGAPPILPGRPPVPPRPTMTRPPVVAQPGRPPVAAGPAAPPPTLAAPAASPAAPARPRGQLPDLPFLSHPEDANRERNIAAVKARKRASAVTPVTAAGLPPPARPDPMVAGQQAALRGMRERKAGPLA